MGACGGSSPEEVALGAARAQAAGDQLKYRSYLTPDDQRVFDQVENTDTLVQLVTASPEWSTTVDSVRIERTFGDTLLVAVFRTVPNYDGGSLRSNETVEELAARLPKTTERRHMVLVKSGRAWRVDARLRDNLSSARHFMPYNDESLPLEVRARHAEGILRTTQLGGDLDRQVRSFIKGGHIAKTLRISVSRPLYGNMTHIDVQNPSGSKLRRVEMVITDGDGVEHHEVVLDVPARGRMRGYGSPMPLPQRGIRLTKVEAD
jgi:hypothetical protein